MCFPHLLQIIAVICSTGGKSIVQLIFCRDFKAFHSRSSLSWAGVVFSTEQAGDPPLV